MLGFFHMIKKMKKMNWTITSSKLLCIKWWVSCAAKKNLLFVKRFWFELLNVSKDKVFYKTFNMSLMNTVAESCHRYHRYTRLLCILFIADNLLSNSAFYTPALHSGFIPQWLNFDLGSLIISKLNSRHVGVYVYCMKNIHIYVFVCVLREY